jgi:hypothetical protein
MDHVVPGWLPSDWATTWCLHLVWHQSDTKRFFGMFRPCRANFQGWSSWQRYASTVGPTPDFSDIIYLLCPVEEHLKDPGVDGRIILRCIFRKWDEGVWIGSIWLRKGTGGGYLWMWQWTFGFHKMRGISWLAENRLASQEGFCSTEFRVWSMKSWEESVGTTDSEIRTKTPENRFISDGSLLISF